MIRERVLMVIGCLALAGCLRSSGGGADAVSGSRQGVAEITESVASIGIVQFDRDQGGAVKGQLLGALRRLNTELDGKAVEVHDLSDALACWAEAGQAGAIPPACRDEASAIAKHKGLHAVLWGRIGDRGIGSYSALWTSPDGETQGMDLMSGEYSRVEWSDFASLLGRIGRDRAERDDEGLAPETILRFADRVGALAETVRAGQNTTIARTQLRMLEADARAARVIRTNDAAGVDAALAAYQRALDGVPRRDFQHVWGSVQQHRGRALLDFGLRFERVALLEQSIAALSEAATVYTPSAFSGANWQQIQMVLALAEMMLGQKRGQLVLVEKSIQRLERVRGWQVKHGQDMADDSLMCRAWLVKAQVARNASSAERAIECLERLATARKSGTPWAETQLQLGFAYEGLAALLSSPTPLQQAAAAYQAALGVYRADVHPRQWQEASDGLKRVQQRQATAPSRGACSGALGVTRTPANNLVDNPGFERGISGWNTSAGFSLVANCANVDTGAQTAEIRDSKPDGTSIAHILANGRAGAKYTLTLSVKVEGNPNWVGAGLDFMDAGGKELAEILIDDILVQAKPQTFTRISKSGTAPPGTHTLVLWIHKNMGGKLYVDEVSLVTE